LRKRRKQKEISESPPIKRGFLIIWILMSMRYVITEQQYDRLRYKRRYEDIKKLIDGLIDGDLSVYYDEDEFYSDIKDLVFRNVFLGNR